MKVLVTERGGGKTTALLEWVRDAPEGELRVLVTDTPERARQLEHNNPDLKKWQVMSFDMIRHPVYDDLWTVLHAQGHVVLGIDDLELAMAHMVRQFPIEVVTMTGERW